MIILSFPTKEQSVFSVALYKVGKRTGNNILRRLTKNEKTDKNNILNNKEYNKIVYWIGGQGIEITDKVDVENIVEILSTVPVERKEKAEERAGGIFLDLISDGNQEERIVILSDYISYNNEYYYTKYDVIPSVEEIIEDEAKKNGLEYLFEDTSTGHQGKKKVK